MFEQLLGEFTADRQEELRRFFDEVARDQRLRRQLTPRGAVGLLSGLTPRPSVAFASVVTRGRPLGARAVVRLGPDVYAHALYAVYRVLALHAAVSDGALICPGEAARRELGRLYGGAPTPRDSDGIVPTLSQPWGPVLAAVWADHLDVIGHYDGSRDQPPHYDWLPSGSRFRRAEFRHLWAKVAAFICQT